MCIPITCTKKTSPISSSPLELLPEDVTANILSFVNSVEDRFRIQVTCKQFRKISNTDAMRIGIEVGGTRHIEQRNHQNNNDHNENTKEDASSCKKRNDGIILESDTPQSASEKLTPYALAGNLEALYMYVYRHKYSQYLIFTFHHDESLTGKSAFLLFFPIRLGIIKAYCVQDVGHGICLLKMAASQGYVRASYALGLVLRDSHPAMAAAYMKQAADAKYLPAHFETLSAREMKNMYGEPSAQVLRNHLDHLCLNRLLTRYYVSSKELRIANTSHCWNPLCGRWAFKATTTALGTASIRPWGFVYSDPTNANTTMSSSSSSSPSSFSSSLGTVASTSTASVHRYCPHAKTQRVSRMKMCSRCCRAKYCSKLCQVYDWRSGRHKMECQFL